MLLTTSTRRKYRKPRHSLRVHIILVMQTEDGLTSESVYAGSVLSAAEPFAKALARAQAHPDYASVCYIKQGQKPDEWLTLYFKK